MVGLRFRSEWRRRWTSLVTLALLVAIVGTAVLAALGGARRTRTAVDRIDEATKAPHGVVMLAPGAPLSTAQAVARLPEVERGGVFAQMYLFPEKGFVGFAAPLDHMFGNAIWRDRVVAGRRPDPAAPLEIAVPQPLARRLALEPGDRMKAYAPSVDQMQCLVGFIAAEDPRCAGIENLFVGSDVDLDRLAGPTVDFEVVGVTRGLVEANSGADALQIVQVAPAFFDRYHDRIPWNPGVAVRFAAGVRESEFERAKRAAVPSDQDNDYYSAITPAETVRSTASTLANGVLVFGGVAALVGLVLLGQAFARHVSESERDRRVLGALGMNRRGQLLDAVVPLAPSIAVGALVALLGAWYVSERFPFGSVRNLEPAPGRKLDSAVVLGALVVAGALVLLASGVAVWGARRRRVAPTRRVRVVLPSVPATVGTAYAFQRQARTLSIPVRSALASAAVGIAGLVAVAVFGASLSQLVHDPARHGWSFDLLVSVDVDEAGVDPGRRNPTEDVVARDKAVEGYSRVWYGMRALVDGRPVVGYAQTPVVGDVGFEVVEGRAPRSADEVALGAKTLRRAGSGVGDDVDVEGRQMRVVGRAIFPASVDNYPLADGALVTEEGMRDLRLLDVGHAWSSGFALRVASGTDTDALAGRMGDVDGSVQREPFLPPEIDQLDQLSDMTRALAAFLLFVAVVAVGHAIVLTVRRRAQELVVLRAVGFTGRQTSRAIAWQASTLAVAATVIGLPIGIVVGRAMWRAVADSIGFAGDPASPWAVLLLVMPVTLALANVIAWWPGRRAARIRPALGLRAE